MRLSESGRRNFINFAKFFENDNASSKPNPVEIKFIGKFVELNRLHAFFYFKSVKYFFGVTENFFENIRVK